MYNKDLIDKYNGGDVPATWEGVLALSEKMKADGVDGYVLRAGAGDPNVTDFLPLPAGHKLLLIRPGFKPGLFLPPKTPCRGILRAGKKKGHPDTLGAKDDVPIKKMRFTHFPNHTWALSLFPSKRS